MNNAKTLVRARKFHAEAADNPDHPYHGLSVEEIRALEKLPAEEGGRKIIPNRAELRRMGVRGGYTRGLTKRLNLAAQIRRMESIIADPARLAQLRERRAQAGLRAERRAERKAG